MSQADNLLHNEPDEQLVSNPNEVSSNKLNNSGSISGANNFIIGSNITDSNITTVFEADKAYDVHGLSNPYIGLKSFSYKECKLYSGHEDALERARYKLVEGKKKSVLFVTGASGSGKSSFAQAGLCPKLVDYYNDVSYKPSLKYHPVISTMHPSSQPLFELEKGLNQLNLFSQEEDFASPETLIQFLKSSTPESQVNILVIDQFEEIFNQADISESEKKFFLVFISLMTELPFAKIRTHLIITLRKDYLGDLYDYPVLLEQKEKHGINLGAMSKEELEKAIQYPLQYYQSLSPGHEDYRTGYEYKRFEEMTLERLAKEASNSATLLPLLQVTLQKLWADGNLKLNKKFCHLTEL